MRVTRHFFTLIILAAAIFQSCKPLDVPGELLTAEVMRPASWTVRAVREGITLGNGAFQYDDAGRLISERVSIFYADGTTVNKSITYTLSYNEQDQLEKVVRSTESFDNEGVKTSTVSSSTGYNYDETGLLTGTSSTYPWSYTASVTDYGYNEDGGISFFGTEASPSSTFTWSQGNLVRWSSDNENYTSYSYDEQGRCIRLRKYSSGLTYLGYLQADFLYDDKGLLTQKSIRDEAGLFSRQTFVWELGESSFDICDVEKYCKYQYGVFSWNGVSY